ncbi:MAG: serine protease, partial [Spirochaetia bacterium]|nr:serine protease [Spirochaetia bacterium]
MNNLLELKGRFEQASRSTDGFGAPNLPAGQSVSVSKLQDLLKNLKELREYWNSQTLLPGALISVHYIKVAAKSNRIQALLGNNSNRPNSSIVGAKFSLDASPKHIITHYVSRDILNESIRRLTDSINILNQQFNGELDHDTIDKINQKKIPYAHKTIFKTNFLNVIVDAYYVEKFDLSIEDAIFEQNAIITIYKTDIKTKQLLEKIG